MRSDEFDDEELTTADLAQSKRPVGSEGGIEDRTGPVLAEPVRFDRNEAERRSRDTLVEGEAFIRNDASVRNDASNGNALDNDAAESTPLFREGELEGLRSRWNSVQAAFVDEPRQAVEQADGLVASAMKRLAEVFAEERSQLEQQWDRGDNVSTEDLRIALQRYRSFFHRLLSV
ncbi:MAG: hypothetical protein WA718_19875 [Terriglobales bacterium]